MLAVFRATCIDAVALAHWYHSAAASSHSAAFSSLTNNQKETYENTICHYTKGRKKNTKTSCCFAKWLFLSHRHCAFFAHPDTLCRCSCGTPAKCISIQCSSWVNGCRGQTSICNRTGPTSLSLVSLVRDVRWKPPCLLSLRRSTGSRIRSELVGCLGISWLQSHNWLHGISHTATWWSKYLAANCSSYLNGGVCSINQCRSTCWPLSPFSLAIPRCEKSQWPLRQIVKYQSILPTSKSKPGLLAESDSLRFMLPVLATVTWSRSEAEFTESTNGKCCKPAHQGQGNHLR